MSKSIVSIVCSLAVAAGASSAWAQALTTVVPAITNLAGKIDLGQIPANTQVRVSAVGSIELYAPNHYQTFADGSLALPLTAGIITWTAENGSYPTVAGGDGINHYPGGGTNWTGFLWSQVGTQSTDTRDLTTVRFGTLVGTFNPSPAAADWFVLGRDTIVTAPHAGARLYAAVNDCVGCEVDNRGSYIVTVGGRTHSLRDDFDAQRNPSGPWSSGFRLTTDTPGTFTRFTTKFFPYVVSVGGWNGFSQFGQVLPTMNKNFSSVSAVTDGATAWLPNEVTSHPGAGRDSVYRFIAPVSGLYTLSGSFRGMSVPGTTSTVLIHRGTTLLFQASVVGYQTIVNMPPQQVSMIAGGVIDLAVTSGADSNSDSTGLNLQIEEPCVGIGREPASLITCGAAVTAFSVTAAGAGPFTYQWQWQPAGPNTAWAAFSNGINLSGQGTSAFNVSGATLPSMNISSIAGAGGNFRCIVTNACGSVTSNEATLTVRAGASDIAGPGGSVGPDGELTADDIIRFINAFTSNNLSVADITGPATPGTPDGEFTADDIILFINRFTTAC